MTEDEMEFIGPNEASIDIQTGGEQEIQEPMPDESKKVFSFFVGFKIAPFATYLFGWIICSTTILQWVLTILLSTVDFWFTKNVAGRLILGMKWSNSVSEDGENKLTFEHFQPVGDGKKYTKTFWLLLYGTTGAWGLFSFFSLIKFNFGWVIVAFINLTLAFSNAWGFMKCNKSTKEGTESPQNDFFRQQFLPYLASRAKESFMP